MAIVKQICSARLLFFKETHFNILNVLRCMKYFFQPVAGLYGGWRGWLRAMSLSCADRPERGHNYYPPNGAYQDAKVELLKIDKH